MKLNFSCLLCYHQIIMKPLTQKQFDYYYAKTDPTEPKPVREIHAIRLANTDYRKNINREQWIREINREAWETAKKYNLSFEKVPTLV